MKKAVILAFLISASVICCAQEPLTVKLYPSTTQESNGLSGPETDFGGGRTGNVSDPEMTVWIPAGESSGQLVVVCPGGGYKYVALDSEGEKAARWLNSQGVAAAILKYRMPNGHPDVPFTDVLRAVELARLHSAEWGVDKSKIGVMGFSAGGHAASMALTRFTDEGNRPDFGILLYPVITMDKSVTHSGSRTRLLGESPGDATAALYSSDLYVSQYTPPVFMVCNRDDRVVDIRNTLRFAGALKDSGISFELHLYPRGGHGWGFDDADGRFPYREEFYVSLSRWLKEMQ